MKKDNKQKVSRLLVELTILLVTVIMILSPVEKKTYSRYNTDTLSYMRGNVVEIQSETLEDSSLGSKQKLGHQKLLVRLSNGEEVCIENYLTETQNVLATEGSRIIVCADEPKNAKPYYTVYSYDRIGEILGLVLFFFVIMIIVGRRKGVDSCLAILFSLVFILCVMLPMLYNGHSAIIMGIITALLATTVTMLLLYGPTRQCLLGIFVTHLGELVACILFAVCSDIFHLTGFQAEEAESLLFIAKNTGLDIRTLLFAGIIISSVGAVMDVAVSVLSAIREISLAQGTLNREMLFKSGMNLGRDMIGTMSNTLIFAFTGGALTTMTAFCSYGVKFNQLFNSDFLAVELTQGICTTLAIVLTIPVAAMVGAIFYTKRKQQ